jgi:hypothetical protein
MDPGQTRTLRPSLRSLLRLTVLAAASLLGAGGRAQAGYVPPGFLDAAPSTAAPVEFQQEPDARREGQVPSQSLHLLWSVQASIGLSGMGSQPSPGGPGGGGPGPVPAATARLAVETPVLVGVVFLETTARRTEAVAGRVFRPPRLS